jgi:hypothetical protein
MESCQCLLEATSRARCEAIVTLATSRERQTRVPQDKFTQQHRNASNVDQIPRSDLFKIATAKICISRETKYLLQGRARTFQPARKGEVQMYIKIPAGIGMRTINS